MKTNVLGKAVIGCRAYTNTALTLTTGVSSTVAFTNEEWDTDTCWSAAANSLVYARTAGTYLVGIAGTFASNATGARILTFNIQDAASNDVTGTRQTGIIAAAASGQNTYVAFSTPVVMGAGYSLVLSARQTSGANLALSSAELWLFQIG